MSRANLLIYLLLVVHSGVLVTRLPARDCSFKETVERLDRAYGQRRACGPICLWYASRYLGVDASFTDIRSMFDDMEGGVQLGEIRDAAARVGLSTRMARVEEIASVQAPAILVVNADHAVLYLGNTNGSHRVFEPSSGRVIEKRWQDFDWSWGGIAVEIEAAHSGDFTPMFWFGVVGFGCIYCLVWWAWCGRTNGHGKASPSASGPPQPSGLS